MSMGTFSSYTALPFTRRGGVGRAMTLPLPAEKDVFSDLAMHDNTMQLVYLDSLLIDDSVVFAPIGILITMPLTREEPLPVSVCLIGERLMQLGIPP